MGERHQRLKRISALREEGAIDDALRWTVAHCLTSPPGGPGDRQRRTVRVGRSSTNGAYMQTTEAVASPPLSLRVGQLVEVRSEDEILATLDANGMLEDLPFMPEMVRFCGQQFRVGAVAHKLCDTQSRTGMRRMTQLRAPGRRGRPLRRWRARRLPGRLPALLEDRLAQAGRRSGRRPTRPAGRRPLRRACCRCWSRRPAARRRHRRRSGARRPSCCGRRRSRCRSRDLAQYVQDVRTGNVSVAWSSRAFLVGMFNRVQGITERVLPNALRFRGGRPWKFLRGRAGASDADGADQPAARRVGPGQVEARRSRRRSTTTCSTAGSASTPKCRGSVGVPPRSPVVLTASSTRRRARC